MIWSRRPSGCSRLPSKRRNLGTGLVRGCQQTSNATEERRAMGRRRYPLRPHILVARKQLQHRWRPASSGPTDVLVLNGKPGPWRQRCDLLVLRLKHVLPDLEILVQTPLGLLPYSLEDLNPLHRLMAHPGYGNVESIRSCFDKNCNDSTSMQIEC